MQTHLPANEPIVQLKGIVKRFPGVLANDHVDFDLYPGEVHTLLGENGAGKTTLMSILYGLYQPDEGEITVKNQRVHFTSAQDAIRHGLEMVHQHFQLVKTFTVAENIILGQPSSRGPLREDKQKVRQRILEISNQYGLNVDPEAKVWQLSVGEQQRVEILKALYRGAEVLILDEPTAVLTPQEASELLTIIKHLLVAQGKAIVFISHKLNEVLAISDRITVLRDGHVVGTVRPKEELTTKNDLARLMVGREVLSSLPKQAQTAGEVCLAVEDLWVNDDRGLPALKGINLEIRAGEIVGFAGVAGNGQRELEEAVRGLRSIEKGRVLMKGREITNHQPFNIISQKVAHIPSDRHGWGMLDDVSVAENLVLETFWQEPYTQRFFLNYKAIRQVAEWLIKLYDVRTPSIMSRAGLLSGGNAQKMVLARELSLRPHFLLAAQPTRGLDISAIEYVHRRLLEERNRGVAILLISTELDEIFALSDRIAVLYEGQIMGVVPSDT
ncbi:MAG TPA: ABC transporter ATP-binding protein, partial [Anaerolineae bacterium]|nr:ABC transporter ATP-binding protein [Anaerolineae bacterium]